eukprot:360123-Chlamydomonas_euryale.AAC.1
MAPTLVWTTATHLALLAPLAEARRRPTGCMDSDPGGLWAAWTGECLMWGPQGGRFVWRLCGPLWPSRPVGLWPAWTGECLVWELCASGALRLATCVPWHCASPRVCHGFAPRHVCAMALRFATSRGRCEGGGEVLQKRCLDLLAGAHMALSAPACAYDAGSPTIHATAW